MSGERKKIGKRGMRDIATVQTRVAGSTPSNRTQAVSRFARLENERMRILRELDTWDARRTEAERMLAKVEAELASLNALLFGAPPAPSGAKRPRRRGRSAENVADSHRHEVGALLEY